MKRKKLFAALFCMALTLILLPGVALADDLEVHISSDPDDVIQYIPLKQEDSSNLSINGVNFIPDITPGNCVKLEGGDALMATLINDDPQFFEGLEVGEPPIKENIFIRHGNAYLSLSDGSKLNLYDQVTQSIIRLMNKLNVDTNRGYGEGPAMKLLEGKKFTIKADEQILISIGIGNVWQAPVPDKNDDPLSHYVPPIVSPNIGGNNPAPAESKVLTIEWAYTATDAADSVTGSQTVKASDVKEEGNIQTTVSPTDAAEEAPNALDMVIVKVYSPSNATEVVGLMYLTGEEEGTPAEVTADNPWELVWKTIETDFELSKGFTRIEIYIDPTWKGEDNETLSGDPTYIIHNTYLATPVDGEEGGGDGGSGGGGGGGI